MGYNCVADSVGLSSFV